MLLTLARNSISIQRTTNEIIDPFTPTTLTDGGSAVTVTTSAQNTARYKSIVSIVSVPAPISSAGSLEITGTNSAGGTITETITIPTSGIGQGSTEFNSITSVKFQGSVLNNCSITVKFIGEDGGSIKARRVLTSCTPAQISRGRGSFPAFREGTTQKEIIRVMLPYVCNTVYTPRDGDLITDLETLAQFLIVGAPLIEQVGISKFYQINAERYQGG